MKTYRKTIGICLFTILMLVMTPLTANMTIALPPQEKLVVSKTVYDGENWVKYVEAKNGDYLTFNITVTYYNTTQQPNYFINNTVVKDYLPVGLQYVQTIEPATPAPQIIGQTIIWDFGEMRLYHGQSIKIVFRVKVNGCNRMTNIVNVTTLEHCNGQRLTKEDAAVVNVLTFIDMEKKVWDPEANQGRGAWVETLPYVLLGEKVKFQIKTTYYGCNYMKCFFVWDLLPSCMNYTNTTLVNIAGININKNDPRYPDIPPPGSVINICGQQFRVLPGMVVWDWSNRMFGLSNGETVTIEFDGIITKYCNCNPQTPIMNIANGLMWGCKECSPCSYLYDSDTAGIICCPPPTLFKKQVWDKREQRWAEQTTVVVGSKVRFQLQLIYHGETKEYMIRVKDRLPECLLYADNANREPTKVSNDNRTIWWNFTKILTDGEILSIQFDALVINSTVCCQAINTADITLQPCQGEPLSYRDTAEVIGAENTPPTPPLLEKSTSGKVNEYISFNIKSYDPDGDQVYYLIDWGDGNNSGWLGPYDQGVITLVKYKWKKAGVYTVKGKAKDINSAQSINWGNNITVTITGTTPPQNITNITITSIKGGLKGVNASIKNNGTKDVKVNWTIYIQRKLMPKKNMMANGTINITHGQVRSVSAKVKGLGVGRVIINVTAKAGSYGSATEIREGFIIGPYVYIKK
ncbi:MAG: hypothetical protein QXS02_00240 [Candidatus Thermoplasmatota archaeon]